MGHPDQQDEQRAILRAALGLLESASEPGAIVDLLFRWPGDDWQAKVVEQYEKEGAIVLRQRTEGEYDVDPATGERRHYAADEALAVVGSV